MRILILTSSTGGGHDMRARSLMTWAGRLKDEFPGMEVRVHQTLESTHGLYRFGVGLYNWIQRTWPVLHQIYFNYLEVAAMHRSAGRIVGKKRFRQVLRDFLPDLVVSVHAHLNHGYFQLAREAVPHVRCVTYCGELFGGYGFSRHWVNPGADLFIGAVGETCEAASRLGMAGIRNWVGGFMLNPDFYDPPDDSDVAMFVRDELGFDPQGFILVLSTGAVGANNHLSLVDGLDRAGMNLQVVALCGKNLEALQSLNDWKSRSGGLSLRALGYFDRMPLMMRAASVMVARPGTGTTSEAMLCGCPLVFNAIGGIMPQEYITTKFARAHHFGRILKKPGDFPALIRDYMTDPDKLADERSAMLAAVPEGPPEEIIRKLATFSHR